MVLAEDGWHPGVIGIVASRVVERIHRPTVLIALDGADDGQGERALDPRLPPVRGDARLLGAPHPLRGAPHGGGVLHLPRRGGRLPRGLRRARARRARPEQLVPEVRIDLEVELHHADDALARMLRHAGPFGAGNPTPVFAARGVGGRAAARW